MFGLRTKLLKFQTTLIGSSPMQMLAERLHTGQLLRLQAYMLYWCNTNNTPSCGSIKEMSSPIRLNINAIEHSR